MGFNERCPGRCKAWTALHSQTSRIRMYRIRLVDGSDDITAADLRDLHKACFADTAPMIDPGEGDWWLAYRDGSPVAFAGMKPSLQLDKAGYLNRAGVLPAHQGRGLQLRLIRARERRARKYGWGWLFTDTTDNPASANSLIKAGFRLYEPDIPWGFVRTLYWRKKLSAPN